MNGLKFLTLITNREYSEQYIEFFKQHEMCGVLDFFANGTASASTLYYLGIEKTEKVIFDLMVRDEKIPDIKRALLRDMNLGGAGNGIAIFLPVDALGGEAAKKQLIGDKPIIKGENNEMDTAQSKLVLIIAIADKGNSETVMNAAREAGATGGTVVRAQGTGASIAKFFGVSITEEKEMIYIVTKRELRDGIMRSVMEKAGSATDAHGIVFSLPVDSVCGVSGLED